MVESTPVLPFPGFKWKWASLQPTESLNRPDLFVGVLRALENNIGKPKSHPDFNKALKKVEAEIGILNGPRLARDNQRNIIRNAGQYWKVLDVLGPQGPITLTNLGLDYANRRISARDFAIHTVLNHRLPSSVYPQSERSDWVKAGIEFRPLLLILEIISKLTTLDNQNGFISECELGYIVQPLSAITRNPERIAQAIVDHRDGQLDISDWPKPVESGANDRRVSDEFLLFMANHDLLTRVGGARSDKKYGFGSALPEDVTVLKNLARSGGLVGNQGIEPEVVRVSNQVARRRVNREVLARPEQRRFRDEVLAASGGTCFLTGTRLPSVLEAAHIRPVSYNGSDLVENGLCLRSDIHTLFDANRIRIDNNGLVSYSPNVKADFAYSNLPIQVNFLPYINRAEVAWRWEYV